MTIRIDRETSSVHVRLEHEAFQRKQWDFAANAVVFEIRPVDGRTLSARILPGDDLNSSGVILAAMAQGLGKRLVWVEDPPGREYPDQFMLPKAMVDDVARAMQNYRPDPEDYDEEEEDEEPMAPPPPMPGTEWMDDGRPASFGPRPIRTVPTASPSAPPWPQGAVRLPEPSPRSRRARRPRPRPPA
jgi:hypothetical protein